MRRQTKRPTRRKPDRPSKQHYFSTIPDYAPPWTVIAGGGLIGLMAVLIPAIASFGYLHGWW